MALSFQSRSTSSPHLLSLSSHSLSLRDPSPLFSTFITILIYHILTLFSLLSSRTHPSQQHEIHNLGEALFQTHENLEHLAMMERVLGPLPQHILKKADRHAEKYVRRGRLDWPEGAASRDSMKAVMKLARLQNLIMQHVDHSAGDLIHLLQGLLKYDPTDRLSAQDALGHPFFTRDRLSRC